MLLKIYLKKLKIIKRAGVQIFTERIFINSYFKGYRKLYSEDLILISDADEIPNFEKLNSSKIKKFALLRQKNFYYKINCPA